LDSNHNLWRLQWIYLGFIQSHDIKIGHAILSAGFGVCKKYLVLEKKFSILQSNR